MVDSRKRASASLKVKYKSTTISQFIQQFGLDISHAGMFIKTKAPLESGALIRLELQLSDGTPVIVGSGRVRWRRPTGSESQAPAGMGIEFTRLDPESRRFVDSIVDGREGRPSRFEQTEGAELAAASPKIASSSPPSAPPISAPPPAGSNARAAPPPTSLPPTPPPPAPPPPTSPPPPTPPPRAVRSSRPPNAPGLFANSRLGATLSTDPFAEAPTQSSFFVPSRVAGAAPSNASQSTLHTGRARDSSVMPVPPSRADAGDRLVDQLFADAITKSGDSHSITGDPHDDLVTSEFRGPDLFRDETSVTTELGPIAPKAADDRHDPPPPLPRPASSRAPALLLNPPSQFPSPPRSKALLVSVVAVLGLTAVAVFLYLH
jgi:uncharacterized protein (TIGR02266 family)